MVIKRNGSGVGQDEGEGNDANDGGEEIGSESDMSKETKGVAENIDRDCHSEKDNCPKEIAL